jgi:hypothetical protein
MQQVNNNIIEYNIIKRKFRWIGHIKKRRLRDTKGCSTLEPSRKQEERKTEKQMEKIGNEGSG